MHPQRSSQVICSSMCWRGPNRYGLAAMLWSGQDHILLAGSTWPARHAKVDALNNAGKSFTKFQLFIVLTCYTVWKQLAPGGSQKVVKTMVTPKPICRKKQKASKSCVFVYVLNHSHGSGWLISRTCWSRFVPTHFFSPMFAPQPHSLQSQSMTMKLCLYPFLQLPRKVRIK